MNVKKLGNAWEKECCKVLADSGYWVHLFAYNVNGQPCDIVAIKGGNALLIDTKHCSTPMFHFKYIQPNQLSSFALATSKGIQCGFAIYFDYIGWKWLDFTTVSNLLKTKTSAVKHEWLDDFYGVINK